MGFVQQLFSTFFLQQDTVRKYIKNMETVT